jgi:hypothetical protein
MHSQASSHENMEDLMRLSPDVKSSRTPCLGHPSLFEKLSQLVDSGNEVSQEHAQLTA